MGETKTDSNPDLHYALEIFARPLPRNIDEHRTDPGILLHKFRALRMFKNMLEKDGQAIVSHDVKAAIDCTTNIMIAKFAPEDADRKEAVLIYIDLLALRPQDVPPKSLDIVFKTIKTLLAQEDDDYNKWVGCDLNLQKVLRDLRNSIDESGFTPKGIDAENHPSLGALVFKGLMHEISDRDYADDLDVCAYIDLVALNDAHIDTENLTIVRNVIDREIFRSKFMEDEDLQTLWNEVSKKFSAALTTYEWKHSLAEDIANLAFVLNHTPTHDPVALHALQQGYKLADQNVGVDGEFRYERIPLPALEALHDAAVENHLASKPISDLAEKLWHRVTVGRTRLSAPA